MSFITPFGAYCYTTMSFGLKYARATYQRAIQMCLDQQIGRNIEAYIDDVVVKSKTTDSLIADLEETFANLKRYRWKLNPSKCIFGVPSDILLGYIVRSRGIEPNPDKVSAITNMKRPTCVKDIKMHFDGFSFHRYLFRLANVSSRSAIRSSAVLDLTTTSSM